MGFKTITVECKNGAYWIRFNRSQRKNAICYNMYGEIFEAMQRAANDSTVCITIFTGMGDFYSSGNDFAPEELVHSLNRGENEPPVYTKWVDALIDHPKPLIALVNGPAIGIACTTLGLFDMVVCSTTAYFYTPFAQLGVCAEGCSSVTFPALMGYTKACRMIMFGERFNANDALQAGLVAKVIPIERFREDTEKLVETWAKFSAKPLQVSKDLLRNDSTRRQLHEVNHKEARKVVELMSDPATLETMQRAFSAGGRKSKM